MIVSISIQSFCLIFLSSAILLRAKKTGNDDTLALLPEQCGERSHTLVEPRIVGGHVSKPGRHPWIANIFFFFLGFEDFPIQPRCGGAILNEKYVLTAGHCCVGNGNETGFVRVGEFNVTQTWECTTFGNCTTNSQDIQVESFEVHPEYELDSNESRSWAHNDLCLMRLKHRIIYQKRYVQPICLPKGGILTSTKTGLEAEIAGWGGTHNGYPEVLMEAKTKILSTSDCDKATAEPNSKHRNDTEFCAVGKRQTACFGDSGSPLVYSEDGSIFTLLGISSYSVTDDIGDSITGRCNTAFVPLVYADITKYLPWILDNLKT